ncbi:hypothetical protein [Nocardia sp. NPDC059239]|uniref:hypothetical protein n=1 Tax=Nocardia sp. NPDC059239 TaxID=3346785 RepID=UPI0036AFF082
MSTKRTLTVLAALPTVLAVGAGAAHAAPGQPGLAEPNGSNPGLTAPNTPPAAPQQSSPASWVPDAEQVIPAPARPKPQYRQPQQTVVTPDTSDGADAPATPAPVVKTLAEQGKVQVGDQVYDLPAGTDSKLLEKAQGYIDMFEWQIAAGYDQLGFSREESDRRAASTVVGAVTGGAIGAEILSVPAALVGGGVGAAIGGLAGGAIAAVPTVGVGIPLGVAAGVAVGFTAGVLVAAVPALVGGAVVGGLAGGAIAAAVGGGANLSQPAAPQPLVEISAPAPAPVAEVGQQVTQVADTLTQGIDAFAPQVKSVADQVAQSSPVADAAVTSLRQAITDMPLVDPATFGEAAAPINGLIGAVQAAAAQ